MRHNIDMHDPLTYIYVEGKQHMMLGSQKYQM